MRHPNNRAALCALLAAAAIPVVFAGMTSSAAAQDEPARSREAMPIEAGTLITQTSVGAITIGMSVAEAEKASGLTFVRSYGDENGLAISVMDGTEQLLAIYAEEGLEMGPDGIAPPINRDAIIGAIGVLDGTYQTANGVHVGMSVADAGAKLGGLEEMYKYPHEGETGTFVEAPLEYRFYFQPAEGEREAGIYQPVDSCTEYDHPASCEVAMAARPGSTIASITVSELPPAQFVTIYTALPASEGSPIITNLSLSGPQDCEQEELKSVYDLNYRLGDKGLYQQFEFEELQGCPDSYVEPRLLAYNDQDQFDVVYVDFNFDGVSDLALRDGMNGGYGFASYQIYLFSAADEKFVLSPEFTELGQYQGMFEVDHEKKMIFNKSRSGHAFRQTDGYTVEGNTPIKVYERTEEQMGGENTVVTKRLVDGVWVTE